MRLLLINLLLALCVVCTWSKHSFATSGWDRHSVDVEGGCRIHGVNGSVVSRLNTSGNPIDPPLVSFAYVPEYVTTSTHILLRGYVISPPNNNASSRLVERPQLRYVAIRKRDSIVIGPMTDDEFATRSFHLGEAVQWSIPRTAADSFSRFVIIAVIVIVCIILALVAVPILIYFHRKKTKITRAHGVGL